MAGSVVRAALRRNLSSKRMPQPTITTVRNLYSTNVIKDNLIRQKGIIHDKTRPSIIYLSYQSQNLRAAAVKPSFSTHFRP
jgi:hypothetical protein